jgi:hypothetical protein
MRQVANYDPDIGNGHDKVRSKERNNRKKSQSIQHSNIPQD